MVKLQGHDGYYSREVTVQGTLFRIRELPDNTFQAFLAASKAIGDKIGDLSRDPMTSSIDDLPPETVVAVIKARREAVDIVMRDGVVGWNIPEVECSPETSVLLPTQVKLSLLNAILADTVLQPEEAAFSSRSVGT